MTVYVKELTFIVEKLNNIWKGETEEKRFWKEEDKAG